MFNLRWYQRECVDRIILSLKHQSSTLAVLATGTGKTVIFANVIKELASLGNSQSTNQARRVLVLANRDELIDQAVSKILGVTGESPGIEKGEDRLDEQCSLFDKKQVVASSVQTMCRPNRQQKFDPQDFGLIITDECHHATAPSYRAVYSYFKAGNPNIKHLGVTATPNRTDQKALGQVYESVCYNYGLEEAIDDGFLVDINQQVIDVNGLDFTKVRELAGDFREDDLEKILTEENVLHQTISPINQIVKGDQQCLVFCLSVAHAHLVSQMLRRYRGDDAAVALSGKNAGTKSDLRKQTVERFNSGGLQFLCSCNLFVEGFDAPSTSVLAMLRPTKSLSLYMQMLGRGTRPLTGVIDAYPGKSQSEERRKAIKASLKPGVLVLDFSGNAGAHKIVSCVDALGGKYSDAVKQFAKEKPADGLDQEEVVFGVDEKLELAEAEMALLAEITERKRRKILARAEFDQREVSPFDRDKKPEKTATAKERLPGDKPTQKQVNYLVYRLNWSEKAALGLSRKQAGAIIGKDIESHAKKKQR